MLYFNDTYGHQSAASCKFDYILMIYKQILIFLKFEKILIYI